MSFSSHLLRNLMFLRQAMTQREGKSAKWATIYSRIRPAVQHVLARDSYLVFDFILCFSLFFKKKKKIYSSAFTSFL